MEQTPSEKNPLDYALNRVSVREYSASEMKRYLKRKGFSEEQCQSTLAELLERGLIDDRRYAGAVARSQLARGKGPRYIQAKLMSKGVRIDAREAKRIYDEASPEDEESAARRVLERRYPNASADPRERSRAYQALLRRGFGSEVVRRLLGNLRTSDE